MKTLLLLISLFLLISCQNKVGDNFETFKNAIISNDKNGVKEFINFPITSKDIWFLIDENYDYQSKITSFNETDFDKHYDKLFPPDFLKLIPKIDSKKLELENHFETEFLIENKKKIKFYIDKTNESITLNFYSEEENIDIGKAEFSTIYVFEILPDNKIKLINIFLAG